MKLAICTIYTPDIKQLAAITTEYNKAKYCKKHNYDLMIKTKDFQFAHLGYEKIRFVKSILQTNQYDWIYWCGADTMITNFNIKLEDLIDNNYHFIVAKDLWDINSDSFFCRNSEQAIDFLNALLDTHDQYIDKNGNAVDFGLTLPDGGARAWGEQGAMVDLYPKFQNIIKLVPQKMINSYLYHLYGSAWHQKGLDAFGNNGSWSQGDFLLHLPGMPNANRINICLGVLPHIVGDENDY